MTTQESQNVTKKHFTNHSMRKTTAGKLKKAGASTTDICMDIKVSRDLPTMIS